VNGGPRPERPARRPGELAFALAFLAFSLFLLTRLGAETRWIAGERLLAQPAFWPAVGLAGMTLGAALYCGTVARAPAPDGGRDEIGLWLRALEYPGWFLGYVWLAPLAGHLVATLGFCLLLTLRAGYREPRLFVGAALAALAIVVTFRTLLQVRLPPGRIYEYLPDGLRQVMQAYF